jgi:hypothetical protein
MGLDLGNVAALDLAVRDEEVFIVAEDMLESLAAVLVLQSGKFQQVLETHIETVRPARAEVYPARMRVM